MTTHKTKVGKSLIEMTPSELIDEIAHLRTTLDRVVAKNKRRRKALKELNKFAIINQKVVREVFTRNATQANSIRSLQARADFAEKMLSRGVNYDLPHSGHRVQITDGPVKQTFWQKLFGVKRASRA